MQTLNPFSETSQLFTLESDLSSKGAQIAIDFKLIDTANLFKLPPKSGNWTASGVERANGLWQKTCFEVFLMPYGSKKYYEFNFSPKPAWNAYQFQTYRAPQPPPPTSDFIIKSMTWNAEVKNLHVEIENMSAHRKFHVGLTAVLVEKNGQKHYCALAHDEIKPDFHRVESFTILRGI
ncbi:MAG: hypothetical protein H7326_06450 [Bdellovibrionaceae bacterium]|nr:hypothetical protein [Pseudobdellovibrionaceae bacterium]